MSRPILTGHTVLDYLDTAVEYFPSQREPLTAIALNKFEWIQLLNLVQQNYNEAKTTVSLSEEGTIATYRDITIYYDGGEAMESEYLYSLDEMRSTMERIRRQNLNPEEQLMMDEPEMSRPRSPSRTGRATVNQGRVYSPEPGRVEVRRLDPQMYQNFSIQASQAVPESATRSSNF